MPRGPYVSEYTQEVMFPIADYGFNEARKAAASYAADMDPWIRSRFLRIDNLPCHDHSEWEYLPDESDECSPEDVYVFETYEGTWRA